MNLDEEAERLLRLHPAVRAGVQPEYRQDYWQPQHAVPRRPALPKPTDWEIEARVMADLAAIDRELDPQAPPDGWTMFLNEVHPIDADLMRNLQRHLAKTRHAYPKGDVRRYGAGSYSTDARGDVIYTPAPPKQRKPKTYVAPGRKAGRTWITRLEQSKQARAKR